MEREPGRRVQITVIAPQVAGDSITLGVVGHRMNRLTLADLINVENRIRSVLDELDHAALAYDLPRSCLTVMSSLAEGADRIVAREAVRRGIAVTAVLPFDRHDYERDFSSERSVQEFRDLLHAATTVIDPSSPANGNRSGYEAASSDVVRHSDILIAVWDGAPSRGPGGTADSIDAAFARGMPILWVGSAPPYFITVISRAESPHPPIIQTILHSILALPGARLHRHADSRV